MKNKLPAIVTTLACLLSPVGETAAAPIHCIFTGVLNGAPTTWSFAIPQLTLFGTSIGAPIIGMNMTRNTAASGAAVANGGGVTLRWTEGPSGQSPFVENVTMTLGSNLQGTGTIIQSAPAGNTLGSASITGANCFLAANLP